MAIKNLSIVLILCVCFFIAFSISNYRGSATVSQNNTCTTGYVDSVSNEKGTVQLISPKQEWYVIIPDYDDTQRFLPDSMPEMFKKNGLKVIFSGNICEIPENVRLIGTPFELTDIEENNGNDK